MGTDDGFDASEASSLASLVVDAYDEFERPPPHLPCGYTLLAELRGLAGFHVPENFGFVTRDDAGRVIVALRGTDSFADLLDDAQTRLVTPFTAHGARCAFGPVQLFGCVRATIVAALENEPGAVFVVGHSLGGAVATIVALDLALHHAKAVHLLTFGATRTGDWRFAWLFRRHVRSAFRVVNPLDLVPHWPPVWLCYRHVGTRVKVHFQGAEGALEQHAMVRYRAAVEAMAGQPAPSSVP